MHAVDDVVDEAHEALEIDTLPARTAGYIYTLGQDPWWDGFDRRATKDKQGHVHTKLLATTHNLILILQNDPRWRSKLRMNLFNPAIDLGKDLPWSMNVKDADTDHITWIDSDAARLHLWFRRSEWQLSPGKDGVLDAVRLVAEHAGYHPVREYLRGLRWDRTPRIDRAFHLFFLVEDSDYTQLVSRFFFLSLVARVEDPGCKLDYVPIFEGAQGGRKSSGLKALMPNPAWFLESDFEIGTKDAFGVIRGKWLGELPELSSLNRANQEKAKAFFTCTTDSYRPPYDRVARDFKRQIGFVGTTNLYRYLDDPSGGRRYQPMRTTANVLEQVRLGEIVAVRDQLWAEALHRHQQRERRYPSGQEEIALFRPQQAERRVDHPWIAVIEHWIHENQRDLQMAGWFLPSDFIARVILAIPIERLRGGTGKEIAAIMERIGWEETKRQDPWTKHDPKHGLPAVIVLGPQKRGYLPSLHAKVA